MVRGKTRLSPCRVGRISPARDAWYTHRAQKTRLSPCRVVRIQHGTHGIPTGPRRHGADRPSDPETSLPSEETPLTNGGNTGVVKSNLLTVHTKRSGAGRGEGQGPVLFLPVHQGAPEGDVGNGAVVSSCHLLH